MNKRAAKRATAEFDGTIGDLRAMLKARERDGTMSVVNAAIPLDQALGIYMAALEGRDDAEKIVIWRQDPYSQRGRMSRTRDAMLVQNILRDSR